MINFLSSKKEFESESDNDNIKIAYLDFIDTKGNKILVAFRDVIITSNGIQAEGNSYVRLDVQMRALECTQKGDK